MHGRVLYNNALSKLLRDLEIDCVPHGFRSSFADWATETGVSYEVAEACLLQTSRLWKRKDSGFADSVGLPQTGTFKVYRGLDPDVRHLLSPYRKPPIGGGGW